VKKKNIIANVKALNEMKWLKGAMTFLESTKIPIERK
jgi:hypothetical protein